MFELRHLDWVVRNRTPKRRVESIGAVLQKARQRAPLRAPAWRARIATVLAEATDELFAAHAWLGTFRSGVLTVNVDDAGLAGVLRMQWHRVLLDVMAREAPELGVIDVRFRAAPPPEAAPRDNTWSRRGGDAPSANA